MSPTSTEDKIRDLYTEVSEAVNEKLLSDATGTNSLYKIHVSLGKIVNNLAEQQEDGARRSASRSVSVCGDERTVVEERTIIPEADIEEGDEDGDADSNEGTVIHREDVTASLVDDLLTDGEP